MKNLSRVNGSAEMKALVIAAGMGSRLSTMTNNRPKPLARLLGLSLVERVILTARNASVREFVVVIGYLGAMIKEELGDGSRYGVEITYIENTEWQRGNALSVLKAREVLKERFFLLMSDHLFEPSVLQEAGSSQLDDKEVLMVVDSAPDDYIDMEDATRVMVRDGRIVSIGKGLSDYNAVDCGIFSCSVSLFDALQESIMHGDETLSGGMQRLADRGMLKAYDLNGRFWIDIDTEEAFRTAEDQLCRSLIKPTDGFISRNLNRPVSIRLSKVLVKTRIKPDTISLSGFTLSLLAALLLSFGNYLPVLLGGLLVQVSSVLDGCDGEVARLKHQQSDYGAWFDAVLDRYADAAVILGLTYGWWNSHGGDYLVWVTGYLALTGSLMNSYTAIKYDTVVLKEQKGSGWRFGRDTRSFLIMLGAVLNQLFALLVVLAVIANFVSVRRLYVLRKT
ncbi:MAG: NTP transferase domain-containing protein [Nitrospirae bacterium]|nr:NTP transferase domain-containing protein [Nitrospirota bacterium]